MKISQKPLQRIYKFLSFTEVPAENPGFCSETSIVYQRPMSISVHRPEKKFMLLSSEAGYFNRVTQFISGNVNSVLFLNVNGNLESPTIEEVSANPQKYFMIYPLPANMYPEILNNEVEFFWESYRFNRINTIRSTTGLTFGLGLEIGRKFFTYKKELHYTLTNFDLTINGCKDEELFWPHKNLILNSNKKFVMGILFGYLMESLEVFDQSERLFEFVNPKNQKPKYGKQKQTDDNLPPLKERLFIKKNDNSYIFSTMLNWLGSSYSFQNIPLLKVEDIETVTKLHMSLPHSLLKEFDEVMKSEEVLTMDEDVITTIENFRKIFKTHEWYITSKNKVRRMPINAKEKSSLNYNTLIDEGKIRLLPMTSFKFIEVKENIDMYDFTMPRADATNYAFAFTPLLKNSDGDILTLSAISGKESIDDAKVFKPAHKEWFRNLNDGNIKNYIADDAILGLFAATKQLGN